MKYPLKSLLTAAASLLLPLCAMAQSPVAEEPDTVSVIPNAQSVTIITTGNQTTVSTLATSPEGNTSEYSYTVNVEENALEQGWNLDLPFTGNTRMGVSEEERSAYRSSHPQGPRTSTTVMRGLYYGGFRCYDSHSSPDFAPGEEVGFLSIIGQKWRIGRSRTSFHVGLGVGRRRYRAAKEYLLFNSKGVLSQESSQGMVNITSAHLDILTFHLPLTFTCNLGRWFAISAGGVVNFNTYGRITDTWTQADTHYKATIKSIRQRFITPDLIANITLPLSDFGIYVRWSPVSPFSADHGPVFRTWSMGASFNF